MTRLALWSAGEHAKRNLLPAIASARDVTLCGILSRNQETVAALCREYDCVRWSSVDEMLADSNVDTILIAGPNGVHTEQARQAIAAGKHVWCEKTFAPTLAEAEMLVRQAEEKNMVVAEAFMFAYHPQFIALQELLKSGDLGRIVSIQSRFGFPHLPFDNIRYSRALAGGALLDVGAYCVAAPLFLLDRDPVKIEGGIAALPGFDVDTDGSAILLFENNVRAIGDWGFGRSYRNEIEIWGEKGVAIASRGFSKPPTLDTTIEITLQKNNEKHVMEIPGGTNQFAAMMQHFARAAREPEVRKQLSSKILRQARVLDILRRSHV